MSEPKTYLTLQSVALPFLALAAFTAFCYFASPILIPIFVSISLAYMLSPFIFVLDRLKIPHFISVLVVLLAAVIIIIFLSYLLFGQASRLVQELPTYWDGILLYLTQFQQTLADKGLIPPGQGTELESLKFENFSWIPNFLARGLGSLFSFIFGSIFVFFLTLFILNDYPHIKAKLIKAFGSSSEELSGKILTEINYQIRSYVVVKFSVTIALSIIYTVGFLLLGIKYAYIWGPLAGLLNLIPYIGPFFGLIPPLIVAGIQFKSFLPMLWVLIFYEAVQILEGNFVTPKLLENKINLSSLAILVSFMFWAWLWGAIGIILAVPITAAVKVACDHVDSLKPIGIILGGKKEI
ncbi:MAG: AI-2E family transporter [candidate division Zixibacteria bacterium]|nr:AI-2E family transporter [candidate division Zixibacteria bacterium]